ncbi:1-deoxy-D-xylulose-5-phosphate reductoisomerase [Limnohabitans sp. Rim47]|uniref:1-deoxy-D-xylulose-5-phosphate reductoisomerase n=1 Tax=Limnohabitans sp. Rim47 TaxID=1100721 RepID=UPI0002EEFFBC|nr:1-deoxy-D-xylulose-5-phosphate reductoisomerase [Limnohabitans sp. Rim47]
MQTKQRITILGSTGSIGKSTLDVLARHPGQFGVYALTASTQVGLMLAQCAQFRPEVAVMVREDEARLLADKLKAEGLNTEVRWGAAALDAVASAPEVDAVMAAIVGAAGLSPCLAAARSGKKLLLANKEALVVGGEVFLTAVREGGAVLLPIDSEHSAIFQSLPEDPSTWQRRVDKIILTASGGPFRGRDPSTLHEVSPDQACAHPNWVMGRKISVDSATMMNKALEVIEARYLFGLDPDQLEVVIHPQSVIHSMVQYKDNSVVAQLGTPDMRVPIAFGLSWPERMVSGAAALDFHALAAMTFESMDDHGHPERFPGLKLAWATLKGAPGSCAVLNAANEIAVEAFLNRQIRFDHIHHVNEATLQNVVSGRPENLDDLLVLDHRSRVAAREVVARLS